jgi:hypothetical protein
MRHLSFANVVSCLALFVALSGGAYAAGVLPSKSVGAKQLKRGAVTSAKVKDKTLTLKDFKAATRTGLRGARGRDGQPGAPGRTGAQGPAGPTAAASIVSASDASLTGSSQTVAGLTLSGGSGRVSLPGSSRVYLTGVVAIYNSEPTANEVQCQGFREAAPGSGTYTDIGEPVFLDFPATDSYDQALALSSSTGPLAPGAYDVRVDCHSFDGPGIIVDSVQLNVIAR